MSPFESSTSSICRHISQSDTECPPRTKLKRSSRKSVKFSPSVSLRFFFINNDPRNNQNAANANSPSSPLWLKEGDVDEIRNNAKTLAKLHCHIRSITNITNKKTLNRSTIITGHAARYQIKGESLRGMEYITDQTVGRKRRRNQEQAMTAAVVEQQAQLIEHVLASSTVDQAVGEAMKMDSCRLAKAYGSKTQEALEYAQLMAREDAEIAAEILAKDLPPQSSQSSQSQVLLSVPSMSTASYNSNDACSSSFVKGPNMERESKRSGKISKLKYNITYEYYQ